MLGLGSCLLSKWRSCNRRAAKKQRNRLNLKENVFLKLACLSRVKVQPEPDDGDDCYCTRAGVDEQSKRSTGAVTLFKGLKG